MKLSTKYSECLAVFFACDAGRYIHVRDAVFSVHDDGPSRFFRLFLRGVNGVEIVVRLYGVGYYLEVAGHEFAHTGAWGSDDAVRICRALLNYGDDVPVDWAAAAEGATELLSI